MRIVAPIPLFSPLVAPKGLIAFFYRIIFFCHAFPKGRFGEKINFLRDSMYLLCQIFFCKQIVKNPAYGRHRISRPMRIDAPLQKEIYKKKNKKNLLQGIWFGGGGAAVNFTADHWSTFYPSNYTSLLSHAVHLTAKLKQIYI